MFLVVACALIVAATMPIADVARGKADLLNKASGLAQKQLEAIRGVGYANINPSSLAGYGLIDSAGAIGTNLYSFTQFRLGQPRQSVKNSSQRKRHRKD